MIFEPSTATLRGRNLVDHSSGPYRVVRVVTPHNVVRMVFPDTKRIVQGIAGKRTAADGREAYAVKNDDPLVGMRTVWVAAPNLPPMVISMVRAAEEEGRATRKAPPRKRKITEAQLEEVLAGHDKRAKASSRGKTSERREAQPVPHRSPFEMENSQLEPSRHASTSARAKASERREGQTAAPHDAPPIGLMNSKFEPNRRTVLVSDSTFRSTVRERTEAGTRTRGSRCSCAKEPDVAHSNSP